MNTGEKDPSLDPRTDYDYISKERKKSNITQDLENIIDGDVRFDEYSRQLYSTDASAYKIIPIGVVFPTSKEDVKKVVQYCSEKKIPILPRGGGTSLAGQAVNKAVVLDFTRYMDDLLSVNVEDKEAVVQPGAVLGEINNEIEKHNLKFAPDPAWGDKSTIGGALGNNSTGSHSLKYGKTDAYIKECEVVLSDGSLVTFRDMKLEELREKSDKEGKIENQIYAEINRIIREEKEKIESSYPKLKRNVSGYNLDKIIKTSKEGKVNLAQILAGSEGTLGIVTEITISLEPIPPEKSMVMLSYKNLIQALKDLKKVLDHSPAAVEVLDGVLLDLARDTEKFEDLVKSTVPEKAGSVLLVEFYAENSKRGKQKVSKLIEDRVNKNSEKKYAFSYTEAHTKEERDRLWKLRKSGLPILLSRTSDEKHISFIEDTAVLPKYLPDYISEFQDLLEKYDTYASFYGHAGPGVLHVRPLINTKEQEGIEKMENIAKEVTDLVIKYKGSVSGEHGDGIARTQWNKKLYGEEIWNIFQRIKNVFDPDWILNPGKVCGDIQITENLRFDPEYDFDAGFEPNLVWDNENGFQGMVELCHGCGGCRGSQKTTGGVMCPTYRASKEEITSTRGRANMLRQAMSGDLPEDPVNDEFMNEVMDLCIGCKGCAKDCPSEVDMAKLKAELQYEYHKRNGSSMRDYIFANIDKVCSVGSSLAPVSNWIKNIPGSNILAEKVLGIAKERSLPEFKRETFEKWYEKNKAKRNNRIVENDNEKFVLFFPDPYTNYIYPRTAKSAIRVLEYCGTNIEIPDVVPSGRAAYSKGFLDRAKKRAEKNIEILFPKVKEGWEIVILEPSDSVMFQLDYLNLLSGEKIKHVSENTYGICEYIDIKDLNFSFKNIKEELVYHGHCHQKATNKDQHAVSILRDAGYQVDNLDSGCCGMAGSFGYESEHYSMSKAIGNILFNQIEKINNKTVVAPGASCRTQLNSRDEESDYPPHPIEKFEDALA